MLLLGGFTVIAQTHRYLHVSVDKHTNSSYTLKCVLRVHIHTYTNKTTSSQTSSQFACVRMAYGRLIPPQSHSHIVRLQHDSVSKLTFPGEHKTTCPAHTNKNSLSSSRVFRTRERTAPTTHTHTPAGRTPHTHARFSYRFGQWRPHARGLVAWTLWRRVCARVRGNVSGSTLQSECVCAWRAGVRAWASVCALLPRGRTRSRRAHVCAPMRGGRWRAAIVGVCVSVRVWVIVRSAQNFRRLLL